MNTQWTDSGQSRSRSGFVWILLTVGFAALSAILALQLYQVTRAATGQSGGGVEGTAVAVVNGEPITRTQLYNAMVARVGRQALDQLIAEVLVEQEARKQNISVNDAEVKAEIEQVKSQFSSEAEFQLVLSQWGLTMPELERQVRFHLHIRRLLEPRVADKLTDAAIEKYYNDNKDRYATQKEQVHVRHILVDTEAEARNVIARLKAGEDFAALARELSKDPGSKDKGGDYGYIDRDTPFVPEFMDAAFSLPVGQVSEPVQTVHGWHVIQVLDRKQAQVPPLAEIREKVRTDLLNEEISPLVDGYLEELKARAQIQNNLETQ